MYERFTASSRHVFVVAGEEALANSHHFIGTEHILLALIQDEGIAGEALKSLGVSLEIAHQAVEAIEGQGSAESKPEYFTPRAKKLIELAYREALQLGHNQVDPYHILLGLIRLRDGVGFQVLTNLGVDPNSARQAVIQVLSGYKRPEAKPSAAKAEERRSEEDVIIAAEAVAAQVRGDVSRLLELLKVQRRTSDRVVETLRAENAALKAANDTLEAENATLMAELDRLRSQLS